MTSTDTTEVCTKTKSPAICQDSSDNTLYPKVGPPSDIRGRALSQDFVCRPPYTPVI